MAASSRMLLRDVMAALDALTIEQTKELVIRFGVQLKTVQDIENEYKSSSRKIHSIQAWLDQDPQASWGKLVSGLKQIKMNRLALQVASQHCLQSPGAASPSTDGHLATVRSVVTPAPVIPAAPSPPPPPSTDSNQPTSPPPSDRCQPVALRSVADVKSAILNLKKTFSKLISRTRSAMCARESQEQEFLDEFRDHLLFLPVAKKAAHVKFFRENEDDILEARNIRKLFAILGRYLSFRNYEILQEIITWFNVPPLQQSMQEYCRMLVNFEMLTPVDIYISAVPEETDNELQQAFSQMVLRIEKPASECTLYDLRKLNESIITNSGLSSHSVYISGVANKCVEVVVRFPPSVVGWVLAALTPHFMTTHHLSEVTVDGSQLTLLQDHRHLNDELIRASIEGDLMMVASLLNSGADIQTVDVNQTPLDWASWLGHLQVVRLLTGRGSEVECRDKDGWTPLISAADEGHCDVVIDLLSLGADVNAQDYDGDSALMKAALLGRTDVVVELVKGGANLDLQNKNGYSALMEAAWPGRTDVVVELVKEGANLDLQNKNGDSAVIRAVVSYKPATLRELVRAGSDLNLQNQEGLTALMIAGRSGRTDITNILLEGQHINLDIQENGTGWSALHFSAERGDWDTTQALLETGASPHLRDKNGLTAMEIAEVKAEEGEERRPYNKHREERPQYNYEGVISLLRGHGKEEPTATTSHHESSDCGHHSAPSTQQDSSTVDQDIPPTQQDIIDTTQIISHQRRGRRNISQALRNLVNRSRQIAVQIFNDLDRRLKSADKKDQPELRAEGRGQGREGKQKMDNRSKRRSEDQTSSSPSAVK